MNLTKPAQAMELRRLSGGSRTSRGGMMEVPWPYDRCILCLGPGPLTEEHIIPDSIGGKLWVRFLCASCNGELGHEIEHSVKNDPAIRLAVERLKERMPILAKKVREGRAYVGNGPTGPVRGRLK